MTTIPPPIDGTLRSLAELKLRDLCTDPNLSDNEIDQFIEEFGSATVLAEVARGWIAGYDFQMKQMLEQRLALEALVARCG